MTPSKAADFKSSGITGLAGLRLGPGAHLAARGDGTVDHVFSPKQPLVNNYTTWGLQGGLSLVLGNRYDSDHGRIENGTDRCPHTPAVSRWMQVDARHPSVMPTATA